VIGIYCLYANCFADVQQQHDQLYSLQVAEILKDRPSWYRDCRAVDILNVLPTANGGTIELLYMQVKQLKLSVYEW
jgi:hypothetical protein